MRQAFKIVLMLAVLVVSWEIFLFRSQRKDNGPVRQPKRYSLEPVPPRIYRRWGRKEVPCIDEVMGNPKRIPKRNFYHTNENNKKGFLYMRPPKCASSTVAGVNLRIARNVARRRNLDLPMCDMSFSHGGQDKGRRFRFRDRDQSYLWTVIREPTARQVSFFWFWGVSVLKQSASDHSFQAFLMEQFPDFYFTYLSPRYDIKSWSGRNSTLNKTQVIDEVNYVLNEYDFIGVTEKLDESLVVLMMLLDLPMADILYYTVKTADNLYFDPKSSRACVALKQGNVSDGMKEFFASNTWKQRMYSDDLLYRAADRSLEMTIDSLGREKVLANVVKLKHAQKVVVQRCRGKVTMECEVEGEPPRRQYDCMHHDMGCGMDCIDQVATDLKLW